MGEDTYPLRSTAIEGACAVAVIGAMQRPQEAVSVRDAAEADKAMGDPENSHCCPLCNEFFSTQLLIAHAPQCIQARAPRNRVWTPAGFSDNAIVSFADKVKPTPGRF